MSKKFTLLFAIIMLLFYSGIALSWEGYHPLTEEVERYYFRGQVEEIVSQSEYRRGLTQVARIRLIGGPKAGETVTITNHFEERNRFMSIILKESMPVLMVGFYRNGELQIHLQDVARDRGLVWAGLLLVVAILLIGKLKGLKTLLTLGLTGFIIIYLMLPLMLAGWPAIPVATFSALLIISIILLIIGGFNSKTVAAIFGTGGGVLIAGLVAYLVGNTANLTGLGTQEAQMLAVGQETLDMQGLLYAGIIIGALGAVTDVGMSIASSAYQLRKTNPQITFWELFSAAMEIGRDIMGTMANTLILAYVGGAVPFLLLLMHNQIHWLRIINMDFIAAEILSGVAGTLGLIIAIPITAMAAALLPRKNLY